MWPREKMISYISNGKAMIIRLIVGLIRQMLLHKINQYFPQTIWTFWSIFQLDLSNYATKADLEGASEVDSSNLSAKSDLASLKAQVDEINVDKLNTVPVDLSKLNNVVNNDVIKKTLYDKLVTKVNAIDTGVFRLKTQMILINQV